MNNSSLIVCEKIRFKPKVSDIDSRERRANGLVAWLRSQSRGDSENVILNSEYSIKSGVNREGLPYGFWRGFGD